MSVCIYRGPLKWVDRPDEPQRWEGPTGTALLDTRPILDQSRVGGAEMDCLFVAPFRLDDRDYELIGEGPPTHIRTTGKHRKALQFSRGKLPQGDTLAQMLASVFTDCADPDGIDGPKPLMPSHGRLKLTAGVELHSERFRYDRRGRSDLIKTMVQRQVRDAVKQADDGELDPKKLNKILGYELRKYGLKKDDWQEFVPPNLRKRIDRAEEPETSVSDDFNRADGSLGSDWANAVGLWEISSNQVRRRTVSTWESVVHQTALSGSDHWGEILDLYTLTNKAPVAAIRKGNNTTKTYYCFFVYNGTGTLAKIINGSQTNIASSSTSGSAVRRCQINGSSLTTYLNPPSTAFLSSTDTAITGNTYVGMASLSASDTTVIDDFAAADIGGGSGSGLIYTQLERTTRGYLRGMYTRV